MSANLKGENLRKSFQDGNTEHKVLDGLSLTCEKGEIVAVTGDSGSGKTTLVNVLSGIELPDQGKVTVAGSRLDNRSERERTLIRRHKMGMIFQFFNLVPTLTVRENIEFPLRMTNRSGDGSVDRFLELLGIQPQAEQFPSTLSGGERQRVAIARALVHQPEVIFADEPTGNLDEANSQTVLNTFRNLCSEREVTVLLSTHSERCASIADREFELRDGTLRSA